MPIHDRGDDFMSIRKSPPRSLTSLVGPHGAQDNDIISALECVAKLCDTLRHSHRMGIIHGDIQPAVIFIGDHGEVILQNWQLSAAVGDRLQPAGTPAWLPPGGGTRGV